MLYPILFMVAIWRTKDSGVLTNVGNMDGVRDKAL